MSLNESVKYMFHRTKEFFTPVTSLRDLGLVGLALNNIAVSSEVTGMLPEKKKAQVRASLTPLPVEAVVHNAEELNQVLELWPDRSVSSVHYRPETHMARWAEFESLVEKIQSDHPEIPYISLHLEHIWVMMNENSSAPISLADILGKMKGLIRNTESKEHVRFLFENTTRRADVAKLPAWTYSLEALSDQNEFRDLMQNGNTKFFGFCPDIAHMGIADRNLYDLLVERGRKINDPLSSPENEKYNKMRSIFKNSPLIHWSRTSTDFTGLVAIGLDRIKLPDDHAVPQPLKDTYKKGTYRFHAIFQAQLTNLLAAHRPVAANHYEYTGLLEALQDLGFSGTFVIESPYVIATLSQLSPLANIKRMIHGKHHRIYTSALVYEAEMLTETIA